MRRGIGIGGSTTPFLAWPSGPISLWRTVSTPKKLNQCGGNSVPGKNFSGSMSKVPAARRTAINPTSSSTVRTRPIQGRRSFIASSIQLIASSSVARKIARIPAKKKGLLSQALSTDRKEITNGGYSAAVIPSAARDLYRGLKAPRFGKRGGYPRRVTVICHEQPAAP